MTLLNLSTDYALRNLFNLASQSDRQVSRRELIQFHGISADHVAKAVQHLAHADYVRADRGWSGGLRLGRSAAQITVGEVIELFEGPVTLLECVSTEGMCVIQPGCRLATPARPGGSAVSGDAEWSPAGGPDGVAGTVPGATFSPVALFVSAVWLLAARKLDRLLVVTVRLPARCGVERSGSDAGSLRRNPMSQRYLPRVVPCALALTLAGVLVVRGYAQGAKPVHPVKMPLPQARQTVSMLNDLYVNTVVLTHGTYVKDRGTVASATVARQIFEAMTKKGWPETHWLSTTGRPFNPANNPRDSFEKDAVAALKKGEVRFERVEAGRLRVATLVPLVDKSCQMCHTRDQVGDPIGGLSYTVQLGGK